MSIGVWVKRILGLLLAVAISVGLWWLRPTPADPAVLAWLEEQEAISATLPEPQPPAEEAPAEGGEQPAPEAPAPEAPPAEGAPAETIPLRIDESRNSIVMRLADGEPARGLVFFQGGLIDPRAYARILQPVAEAGILVAIVKSPFDLPITDIGGVRSIVDAYPEITWWAVGGHSLGGVAAATYAAGSPRTTPGLLLWASYPFSSLASVEVSVLSVSGTADGLTTPADIEANKPNLPPDTTYVAIEGAIHAYFGDYGEQAGDGVPTISREEAQQQIVDATLQWLNTAAGVA